ncbi:MAG: DUF882 domain-containing protein [Rhodobiaceae bacterium]|nr:DUF882 domain-containing protein [Geminicoccaceae bacterium]MCC0014657.1 DUF882 domain-containing protein [Rhodobiaceae bacterium]
MTSSSPASPHRRRVLAGLAGGIVAVAAAPNAIAALPERRIAIHHLHTGERLDLTYKRGSRYLPDALARLDYHLRDWRQNSTRHIDPKLYDILTEIAARLDHDPVFEIICGYRSPRTNTMLRKRSSGVARRSLHLAGRAIDFRIRGAELARVRDASMKLAAGGVGYYPSSDFIHVDTGHVRHWQG